jgi:cytoskeleton protein RodZ
VKPPVSVVVGNALGVSVDMNGKPIDLAPHMRGNVARVKLK